MRVDRWSCAVVAAAGLVLGGCRRAEPEGGSSIRGAETTAAARPASTSAPEPRPPAAPENTPGDPERRDALFRQAEQLAALLDDDRAIRKLEKAAQVGPEDARTRRLLGLLKLRRDSDVVGARTELRRAAALDPSDPEPHLLLASLALEAGDASAARGHVDEALLRSPRLAAARVLEARLLSEAGDGPGALQRLDALVAEGDAPADAFLERGKLRLHSDDAEGALSDFETARRLAPTDTRVRFNLAQALRRLDRVEEAAVAQAEFEILRPVFSLSKHDLEPDPRRRLARLRAICERFPDLWAARVERARLELSVEGPAAARATLEAARDAFPAEPEIRRTLALVLERLGEGAEAEDEREEEARLREERSP